MMQGARNFFPVLRPVVPVESGSEAINKLDLRLPAEQLFRQSVIRNAVHGASGHFAVQQHRQVIFACIAQNFAYRIDYSCTLVCAQINRRPIFNFLCG